MMRTIFGPDIASVVHKCTISLEVYRLRDDIIRILNTIVDQCHHRSGIISCWRGTDDAINRHLNIDAYVFDTLLRHICLATPLTYNQFITFHDYHPCVKWRGHVVWVKYDVCGCITLH